MRVAVTGAAGFLGSALCAAAPSDWEIVAVGHVRDPDRLQEAASRPLRILDHDISADGAALCDALAGAEVVFHLAAVAGEDRCLADPVKAAVSNIVGTRMVVEAARASGVRRTVFASSYWVYSVFRERVMPLSEQDPLWTDTFYGALKIAGEEIVASLHGSVVARLSNVYGYGTGIGAQWGGFVGRSVRAARAGDPIRVFGTGSQGLELLHVDDAVRAFIMLARQAELRHRIYNVGAGRATPVSEVAAAIADIEERTSGRRPEIVREPAPPGKIWPDRWLDIRRAHEELGFRPRTTLEHGLSELMDRYQAPSVAE